MAKTPYKVTFGIHFDMEEVDVLYLKTDPYQHPRSWTGLSFERDGTVRYVLRMGDNEETYHSAHEISESEDVVLRQKHGGE
jgi:uracil DNA glycosylase